MADSKIITSMMDEKRVFNPSKESSQHAYIKSMDEYKELYRQSIENPEAYWSEVASQLHW